MKSSLTQPRIETLLLICRDWHGRQDLALKSPGGLEFFLDFPRRPVSIVVEQQKGSQHALHQMRDNFVLAFPSFPAQLCRLAER